jgi:predicted NACHT family NTPase
MEFFNEVLSQGNSPKSRGNRLLITGEAGAGKTTLLQKIADWVFAETSDLVIWVSLASLGNRNLEEYLQTNWLEKYLQTNWLARANKLLRLPDNYQEGLQNLFASGKVWLLLDGVDEIGGATPLREIVSQLRGWVGNARVVMSCRVNSWEREKDVVR